MVSSSLAIIGCEKILWNLLLENEPRLFRSALVFSSPTLPSNLPGHAPGDYHVNFTYKCVCSEKKEALWGEEEEEEMGVQ